MTASIARISLTSVGLHEVQAALADMCCLDFSGCGIEIQVISVEEEIAFSDQYMDRNELADVSGIARFFDVRVSIFAYSAPGSVGKEVAPVLFDRIGQRLSCILGTTAIVEFDDGDILFRVFEKGVTVYDNSSKCTKFLKETVKWFPFN